LFSEVVIKLHSDYYQGKEFKIVSSGNTTKNTYIKRAKLNGKNLNNSWIDWKEITSGGELNLKTSTKPNKKWGVKIPPPSLQ
jgi:putative alpha-1,2-mannosidase